MTFSMIGFAGVCVGAVSMLSAIKVYRKAEELLDCAILVSNETQKRIERAQALIEANK